MPQMTVTPRGVKKLLATCAVAFALTSAPTLAYAQGEPSAADSETALQLYKDGKALREKGDNDAALEKLRAAFALVETPIIAVELAKAYTGKQKLVEAREVLLTVSRMPVRKNESEKAAEARREAETLAAQLKPRLASLRVKVTGLAAGETPKLAVDGASVPPDAAGVPRIVNPGAHVVTVDVGGKSTKGEVTLAEGESRELEIAAPEKDAGGPSTPGQPTTGSEKSGLKSGLVYGGFGVAVVGLGVGTITGIMTLSKAGTLKDNCTSDGRCPASSQSDIDGATTLGTVSTIGFIVGGVGLAAGIIGLVAFPDKASTTGAAARKPGVFYDGTGFRGTF